MAIDSDKNPRYCHAQFKSSQLQSHWREPLFNSSKQLVKEDFDDLSISTIQRYALQATYHLPFGGTRNALLCLGKPQNLSC